MDIICCICSNKIGWSLAATTAICNSCIRTGKKHNKPSQRGQYTFVEEDTEDAVTVIKAAPCKSW